MSFRAAARIPLSRSVLQSYIRQPALRQFHTTPSNMGIETFTSKAAFQEAVKTNRIVFIDAFAEWCGPCKAVAPLIAKFAEDDRFKDILFAKFDVDATPDLGQELGITAMPTFLIFKDGNLADKLVGAIPAKIEQLLVGNL
ncbi:putative thioredoxin G6G8.7 [Xylaria sp. CBS 124048]|nr:putative thioredoxin G6G8.7 [Xylaria sp. CBS 124048]